METTILEQTEQHLTELSDEYFDRITKLEETFGEKKIEEAVNLAFDFLNRRLVEMRESAFKEYRAAAAKGLSFKERQKLVNWNKLKWCDGEVKRMADLKKNHRIIPIAGWFQPEDWNWIKSAGLRRFIELNFNRIVIKP